MRYNCSKKVSARVLWETNVLFISLIINFNTHYFPGLFSLAVDEILISLANLFAKKLCNFLQSNFYCLTLCFAPYFCLHLSFIIDLSGSDRIIFIYLKKNHFKPYIVFCFFFYYLRPMNETAPTTTEQPDEGM